MVLSNPSLSLIKLMLIGSFDKLFHFQVPPYSNNNQLCSADHHLNTWLEQKRFQDSPRKAAKMAMLTREANLRKDLLEGIRQERTAYTNKQNGSKYDLRITDREHGRCHMIIEYEDEKSLAGRSNFLTEPFRSRTVSFYNKKKQ